MTAVGSKCRVCKAPAVIDLPRHNAKFCAEHLQQLCRRQMAKAIDDFDMLSPDDRILVAVSGGKDSLAVWDMLIEAGYRADGLYIGLGIGEYSEDSGGYVRRFADERGLQLQTIDLREEYGYDVPTASRATGRVPCSACGLSKRRLFDQAALDGGYDVVVTGHNLDDEAAVLFGNTLRWDIDYLARQMPVLPAANGFPKKVKPLIRLTEREMAAWCLVRGIDYVVEECPIAAGNRHLSYKESLNAVEAKSPGAKASFYLGFLDRMAPLLAGKSAAAAGELNRCTHCGSPTTGEVCAFCRLVEKASARRPRAGRDGVDTWWEGEAAMTRVFTAGEKALLLDSKKRRYLVDLTDDGEFHSHNGFVAHAGVIGQREGVVVRSTKGSEYTVLRPTLEDFVVEMPRGAQVIYPKDLAPICMLADIGPGVRVFETGIGSGALSMTMLRYGAEIVGYEIREDFANRAKKNVESFLGAAALERYEVHIADSYERDRPGARHVRSGRARSARAVERGTERRGGAAARRIARRVHAIDHAGRAGPRGVEGQVDRRPHDRGAAPRLAHRGPGRATRPPDGRPHRVLERRPVPRSQSELTRRR